MSILPKSIESVAVIGAGPCGAGFTKALLAEGFVKKVKVFEKRCTFGGVWCYTPPLDEVSETLIETPTDSKPYKLDFLDYKLHENIPSHRLGQSYLWPSPMYDFLDTNVPSELMAYKNSRWLETVPLFPRHPQVLEYLQNYSKGIEDYVLFGQKVVSVSQRPDLKWSVTSRPVVPETEGAEVPCNDIPQYADQTELFDCVVVASGNYDVPFVPDRPGLREWKEKYPGSVIHSKDYKAPYQFESDKNILVVGNSASGADIAFSLATTLKRKIFKSARSENSLPAGKDDRIITVPDISMFDPERQTVTFVDGSEVPEVTRVIFATGYFRHFAFMSQLNETPTPLITDGEKVHNLYKHLLSYAYPGLAVVSIPRFTLPTRVSESQGAWLARVFSGRIALPSKAEMEKLEADRIAKTGNGKAYHDLKYPEDVLYCNDLNREILEAGDDHGYIPVLWDEKQTRLRGAIKEIKECYIAHKTRTGVLASSIEELERDAGLVMPQVDTSIFEF